MEDKQAEIYHPPSSILIIGAGVFGLSTLYHLLHSPTYASTKITLLAPSPTENACASQDHSRIIRSDYSTPPYARMAAAAHQQWRTTHWGADGRYTESGLVLTVRQKKQGGYAEKSFDIIRTSTLDQASQVQELTSPEEIRAAAKLPPHSSPSSDDANTVGSWGYVNPTAGWGDASAGLAYLWSLITSESHANLTIVPDVAQRLLHSGSTVTGASTAAHGDLMADLTIVAAGAWTPGLIDLRGRAACTLQPLLYVPLTDGQLAASAQMRTLLSFENDGLFVIPPHPGHKVAKAAGHLLGYQWRTAVGDMFSVPEADDHPSEEGGLSGAETTISLPPPHSLLQSQTRKLNGISIPGPVPEAMLSKLYSFLRALLPYLPAAPPEGSWSRLCSYCDTPRGDFMVCYPPRTKGLFVATGDSGHGYKFLPVLGGEVLKVLEGRGGEEWERLWAWKERVEGWEGGTRDGSRGGEGVEGLVL